MQVAYSGQIEIAAMLSQIGGVAILPDTLEKAYRGGALQAREVHMLEARPGIAGELIRNIPRSEAVARVVVCQGKCYDGSGIPQDAVRGDDIPLGARISS
jgi:response regulator RpfG family c-di-GMP phosphodiesterase